MAHYSPNPEVQATIEALLAVGCPPIPVAPKQNPRDEWCHRVVGTKEGHLYCPLDKDLNPIPKFTGKNPSYLDHNGSPRICKHGEFQDRLPRDEELRRFFCHPDTGVGTLGGHAGVDWLDFDAKCYPSQEACDSDVERIISLNALRGSWIERTGSGGWRVAVRPQQKPTFTNFATSPDGAHVGEALFAGRFTVLAPTIHPNGNPYRRIGWGEPIEVESLQAIGIFPSKDEVEQAARNRKREERKRSNPHYGQPTNPQDDPWDIRNFAHYFEGYHDLGDGWAAAKCPHHNGTSQTSFRVRLDTGEYKLWCGCNTKDVYRSGLALAVSMGYKLPECTHDEPDSQLYTDYTAGEEEQERVAVAQEEEAFSHWFKNQIRRLKRLGNWRKSVEGSNRELPPIQPAPQPTLRYRPDKPLPRLSDFAGQVPPRIIFEKGKRLEVITQLKRLGWKKVLDRSHTGSGKSYDAGRLHPEAESTSKLWYFDQNHRNCSTETVEDWHDMPVRHNGLVAIEGKFTPKGQPHLRWASPDEVHSTPSLCHNAELFIKLREKGFNVDSEKEIVADNEGKAQERNPICKQCRFAWKCHQETGKGYGYLYERRQAMKQRRIRASLDSAPNPGNYDNGYDYSSDTAFVEEASRHLRGTQTISAWQSDLANLWARVEREDPDAFEALKSIRFALQDAVEGKFDRIENGLNRGADHKALIEALPDPSTIANLPELIGRVREATPTVKDLVEEPDTVTGLGGKWRSIGQFARNQFKAQAAQQTQENIEALPPNILGHILEIWAGRKPGSLRVCGKRVSVTIPDTRHAEILNSMKSVVFLDATGDKRILAKRLGVSPNTIVEIEEERPPLSNLTVFNVNMRGMGSSQISEACKSRQLALLDWIRQQHLYFLVLANQGDTHLPLDGWWFNDNRGSNAFKGVETLAAFNTPRPNLGVIQDEYRTLFGTLDGFKEYYKDLIQAEIVQLIGRQRAHLYPDKQFVLYLVGTNQDLSFLEQYGIRVVNKEAFELCPLAGTLIEQTRWRILQAVGVLSDQKEKLTQQAIAQLCGLTQGRLSQIAADWGGWKAFKKLLVVLLGIYRGANKLGELTEEEQFHAKTYLPLTWDESPEYALAESVKILKIYGAKATERIFSTLPAELGAKLLAAMVGQLPWQLQREFEQLAAPPPISVYINNGGGAAPETLGKSTVSAEMGRKPETGLEPTGAEEKSVPDRVPHLRGIIAIPRKKVYGQLLVQAFEYGIETFKELLAPWTQQERWEAIREFERLAPESMERLHTIAPNWLDWCVSL